METNELIQLILDGKVYANVDSVSSSGMSRKISFYCVYNGYIRNITSDIHKLKGYGTLTKKGNLRVSGCGMDMVFATLYYSLDYEISKDRNQHYSFLPHN